ncbi:MAG: PAS domain S-box protein [Acidobacteria bacterium]|nr:PAS domain S-box protein [Acidobacteriota bacterium]MCA1641786.1 PAS domain S-box protein [Acidobacteriota bacterium]
MTENDLTAEADGGRRRRLWWLIAGRASVALVMVAAALLSARDRLSPTAEARGVLPIAAFILALTLLYALALRFSPLPLGAQSCAQFFFDVVTVTWLVGAANDLHTPYVALYVVVISLASVYLGARGALVTAVGCAVCYTSLTLAPAFGFARAVGDEITAASTGELITNVGLYDVAFLFVGLLAARLAERQARSDVQLVAATHALANLRALHERIVESIRSGVVTTDLGGRIYTFNAAAAEITGYEADALRGKDVSILFGQTADKIALALDAATRGKLNPRFEAECLTAEGLRLRLGYSIAPLHDERGETTGVIITFQDLTQVRALEETQRRQDRLAAVGRVAAGIAHEIRNPLAAMRGSIQVLRSEVDGGSAQAELMEIILRESDRLNGIITDFLTYARPRQVSLAATDLRESLRETFTLLRHSPETRPDHLIEEDYPEEPVGVNADAAGLRQVFWNLARNALQAMPEGGTLGVSLKRTEEGRVRVSFADTGQGMSPEQVERLFEPFSSTRAGGTGLGLSIAYQIVRDHGGTINVRSLEGRGTTIIIELPGNHK